MLRDNDRFHMQWATFAVDGILMVLLVALVLRSHRWWPIFMAGFNLLAILTHAGKLIDPKLSSWAYYTAAEIWGYLILVSLVVGACSAWRDRQLVKLGGVPEMDLLPRRDRF